MKSIRWFSHSNLALSPFRVTFSLGASVFIALALASPLLAQGVHKAAANGPLPPSMQKSVQVMVEMNDAPVANMYAAALAVAQAKADAAQNYALAHPSLPSSIALLNQKPAPLQIDSAAKSQIESAVQQLDQKQQAMLPTLTGSMGGKVIYRAQRVYNGIAMVVSPDKIYDITKLPGVKAVHPMNPKYLVTTFSDIDFLNTRPAWTTGPSGTHGENIKVADIDTGLDYINKIFVGSGSAADYSSTSDTSAVPNANFPTSKIPGGTDLVGDNYNASGSGSQLIPVPDNNPFDCAGHGTATASLIAGFGVTNAGATYAGTYDASNPVISSLKIPPGFAPEAKIYPVRVFGCAGSTNVVVQAIEWAVTNGMNVINMSLGSNEGFADDPDAVAATNASAAGLLVCSAAGNAGDSYYIASDPGAAGGTLEVAASFNDQAGFIFDSNVTGNAPAAIAGTKFFSIKGTASAAIPGGGITGNVVYAVPNDANATALSNAAQVNGNICLIDRGATTFTDKITKAFNAGATAVIIDNFNHPGADPILMSTAGQPAGIADVMISRTDRDTINTAAGGFDPVTGLPANPVNVTINNDSGAITHGGAAPDTMTSYSSRGPRLPDSAIKPDITAPAEVTAVAQSAAERPAGPFNGNGVENFNGTSSATPHVAGEMTLLRQLHPTWTQEELRALAMNTATHDLFTDTTYTIQDGVGRVGAGRIDIGKAAAASVIAFGAHPASSPGLIGVSFGVVETPVAGSSTLTQNIIVENKGKNTVTYDVTYQEVTPVSNATMTFPTSSFTVHQGQKKNIPVQFSATGSDLKHVREASVASTQGGVPRQWLTEETGYAVFTPTSGPEQPIRVPLYAAVKPASSMHATGTGFVPTANTGSSTIGLSGKAVNTGPNLGNGFQIRSLVKAFELQYQSVFVGQPHPPTDRNIIKYAGVTSDYANWGSGAAKGNTTVMFGAEKFGDAATPDFASSDTEIDFDTNPADIGVTFVADHAIFLTNLGTGLENVFVTEVVDLTTFSAFIESFTNGLDASVADTNIYNNSGIVFPIFAQDIGLIGSSGTGNTKFQYVVVTFDRSGNLVDESKLLVYDLANPGLEVDNSGAAAGVTSTSEGGPNAFFEPFYYNDTPANSVPVNYNGTNFQANGSLGVWLLHMHNGNGSRSDVVAFLKPFISGFGPTHGSVGTSVTITGANFGAGDTVAFNGTPSTSINVINSGKLNAIVPSGATTGPISVSNAAGTATSSQSFTVTP